MLISVITICFNDFDNLMKTKDSIDDQGYQNIEWVVIDGGSKDGTQDFLHQLRRERFTYISESDKGIYDAMNKGVAKSSGDYAIFLNAGDRFYSDESLENAVMVLQAKAPDILYCGAELKFPSGKIVIRRPKSAVNYIWHGVPANHQATIYHTRCLREYAYSLDYQICGDYYLAATLYNAERIDCVHDQVLSSFEIGGISTQRPFQLMKEAYLIQRAALKQNFLVCCASLAKRSVSLLSVTLLNRWKFLWKLKGNSGHTTPG